MALSLLSSRLCLPPPHVPPVSRAAPFSSNGGGSSSLWFLLTRCPEIAPPSPRCLPASRAPSVGGDGAGNECSGGPVFLDDGLLRRVSGAKDADQVLEVIAEHRGDGSGGVVGADECCSIIEAALERNNAELALSVFAAMRSSSGEGVGGEGPHVARWKWGRPDVRTYGLLVRGLARSMKVSDAFRIIANVSRAGIPSEEEMPFGKIVRCPTCMIAIAVAQPQNGIQVASCSKCRYQYELVSGDIVSIDSEETRVCSLPNAASKFQLGKSG